jgi:hypothetical protein
MLTSVCSVSLWLMQQRRAGSSAASLRAVQAKDVASHARAAQEAYTEQQLQYSKVWPLLLLAGKLHVLLKDVRPADARFQARSCPPPSALPRCCFRCLSQHGDGMLAYAAPCRTLRLLATTMMCCQLAGILEGHYRYSWLTHRTCACSKATARRPSRRASRAATRASTASSATSRRARRSTSCAPAPLARTCCLVSGCAH